MSNDDIQFSDSHDNPMNYIFETYSDRERLYHQFNLTKDEFNNFLDQALELGQLDLNPNSARWRVLDVGCGEGLFSEEIVSHYPHARVVGFDRDPEAYSGLVCQDIELR